VWAELAVRLRDAGRRRNANDLWIAALAVANRMPVLTQYADFDVLTELGLAGVKLAAVQLADVVRV
jgi:predicted nucleic acid-binding protein